jgi:tripartite-type tricarboxylate transporter receptor subunit TctC
MKLRPSLALAAERRRALATVAGLACCLVRPLRAQTAGWPTRSPRYVVPFATGGVTDNVGRLLAQKLGERLGQTVVVENRPGVSGIVGTQSVARATPDGYTMMAGTITTHAVNPFLVKQLGYDPVRDFTPVTLVGTVSNVLVVNADSRIDSVQALIDELRRRSDGLTYGTSGPGTSQHLSGQLFQHLTGTRMRQVPYKGGTQALVDLVGGQIDMVFDTVSAAKTLLDAKRIKPLAVTSRQRLTALPGVPTLIEAGVPGFEMQSWQAVFMPAGVDAAIVDRLQQELAAVLRQSEVQARLREMGVEPDGRGAAELAAFQRAEVAKWGRVIQAAGIQAE